MQVRQSEIDKADEQNKDEGPKTRTYMAILRCLHGLDKEEDGASSTEKEEEEGEEEEEMEVLDED